jgi:hypothetical protein
VYSTIHKQIVALILADISYLIDLIIPTQASNHEYPNLGRRWHPLPLLVIHLNPKILKEIV